MLFSTFRTKFLYLAVVYHVAESIALETPQWIGDIRPDFEK